MVRKVAAIRDVHCKFCGSRDTVRYGSVNGVQQFFCKQCRRKFADNAAAPHMRTPARQVAAALSAYFGGMSLNEVRRHLQQQYNNSPAESTVYEWLKRFGKIAIEEDKLHMPKVGDTWIADETVLKVSYAPGKHHNIWFWDIIDERTRFLLASHMSVTRHTSDAKTLVTRAAARAGKTPKVIHTDSLAAYIDGIELAFGSDTRHVRVKGLTAKQNSNIIERFHGTLKQRTKVMRGLKRMDTARFLLDAWLVHYNNFRPHETLKDRTPAEAAGSDYPYRDWSDVIGRQYAVQPTVHADVVETLEPLVQKTMHSPAARRALHMPTVPKTPKPRTRPYMTSTKRGPYYMTNAPGGVVLSWNLPRGARVQRRRRR